MEVIDLARQIGKAFQNNESYINMRIMKDISEKDKELQELIGEFNLKRLAVNNEVQKENHNKEKVQTLNKELQEIYAKIMENENMKNYNKAQESVNELFKEVNYIISRSLEGEDPDKIDPGDICSGNCSSCNGGCH